LSNLRFKIKDEFISTTTELVSNSITVYYKEYIDSQAGTTFNNIGNVGNGYEWADGSATYYEYGVNNYETTVPVIIFACEKDYADAYRDKFYYIGTDSIDGITYDKWQKIESPDQSSGNSNQGWTSRQKQLIYTNVIVEDLGGLNKFELSEKTLKTAGKWCTANIEAVLDPAEINPEYIRSGVEVFGKVGTYGHSSTELVTIPAGIYELIFNPGSDYYAKGIFNFYYCGSLYTGFYVPPGNVMTFYRADGDSSSRLFLIGSSASNPGGMDESTTWLEYLVYVPEDMTVSKEDAEGWYSQMHPYVSSAALGTSTFKLPDELPGIGNDAPSTYIRECLKKLGTPSANGFYIDGVIYDAKVPFVGGNTFSGIAFVDDYNQETSSILIKNATSSGYDRVLYFGEDSGHDGGNFELSFDNSEDWQYWRMKNNYSEVTPEILAFLIAIGAEPDPTYECDMCGETCYVSDCEVLWRCADCKDKICNHDPNDAGHTSMTECMAVGDYYHCWVCKYCGEQSEQEACSWNPDNAYKCYSCGNVWPDRVGCSSCNYGQKDYCTNCGYGYDYCPGCGHKAYRSGDCFWCQNMAIHQAELATGSIVHNYGDYCAYCGLIPTYDQMQSGENTPGGYYFNNNTEYCAWLGQHSHDEFHPMRYHLAAAWKCANGSDNCGATGSYCVYYDTDEYGVPYTRKPGMDDLGCPIPGCGYPTVNIIGYDSPYELGEY
jgi:hypothetical protein